MADRGMNPHGWPPLAMKAGHAFYIFQRSGTVLVLSRLKDEEIIIGDNIRVMVIDIRGDKVRLGITAPREISIHRLEVYEAIKAAEATTDSDCD